jgi:predicted extracellular nuclease
VTGVVMAVVAAALTVVAAPAAEAAPVVVGSDLTGGAPVNLLSFTNDAPTFTSPADGFDVFQRGVSPSIPFALLDDSVTIAPTDTLGIIDETDTGPFFGVVDTVNPDTTGPLSASWTFDIAGSSNLAVSIDVGAMGDFESTDSFELTASIDGAAPASLLSLVADEAGTHDYTLANGTVVTLADPLMVGSVELSNVLQTVSAPVVGTGSELTLTFTASTDGGSEAVAFRNMVITADDTPPPGPQLELIHNIQGTGPEVAITGPVEVQGIVTSLLQRDDVLDGFFLQEEDADADGDAATSEGIFVFCRGTCPTTLAIGDLATVAGTATEAFGMSQIDMRSGSVVVDSSANPLPTAVSVDLPASGSTVAAETFEAVEGMVVTFPDTLVVSEYFQLARFGQVVLTESSRPYQYTHDNAPSVSGYAAFLEDLARRRIILDDDSNDNNDAISDGPDEAYYHPEGGLSVGNRFRGGDTITNLTGVMHWSFAGSSGTDAWRIRPIPGAFDYSFTPVNPAPTTPTPVGGTTTVATMNVLNYFTTIDVTSSNSTGDCGPSGTLDCRGADSVAELDRQRAKIVAALVELDADVVGLVELENDGDDASIADLVAGLNAATAPGTYAYIATGFIGDDAIKVGLIYQPGSVDPVGDFAILDSSVDPAFIDTKNRPVLIQTFAESATQERFTVAVNHLKSKGSPCDDVGDPGLNDGQANCAGTRTAAASALASYLATDPTGSGDPDFLILGDLNAYAAEDAVTALTGAGYTDLVAEFGGPGAYSFVFDGQLGYLDHALASQSMVEQVTGAAHWHVNADEINVFDYNDDVRDAGEASFERESEAAPIYDPDPLRSSDHDPLVVGLNLSSIPVCHGQEATIVGTPGNDVIIGTNGADVIVTFAGNDLVVGRNGNDVICGGDGDDAIVGGNGADLLDGGDGDDALFGGNGIDTIIGGSGSDALAGGNGDDSLDGGPDADIGDGGRGRDTCTSVETARRCEL